MGANDLPSRDVLGIPVGSTRSDRSPAANAEGEPVRNDHLALFYSGFEERMAAVVPFIEQGLNRGEACVYIVDERDEADVEEAFRERGIDVEAARDAGRLSIYTAEEVYLQGGSFDRNEMLTFCEETLVSARENGATGVRATAEMTWALDEGTDSEELTAYESLLNLLHAGDYVMMCQYDQERFPTEVLSDIIRTHPVVVADERAWSNPHYVPATEFQFSNGDWGTLDVDRTLERFRDRSATSRNTPAGERAPDAADERVLVSLADETNGRMLADWLEERYGSTVVVDSPAALETNSFGLCVLDVETFSRHRETLIEQKRAAEPQLLPYLLVHRDDNVPRDPDIRQYADEVLTMPTDKDTLSWRIDTLRRLREQSRELAQKNEQIEQLASAAAHDLRNPLGVAMGWLDEIDSDGAVDRIAHAHDRMEALIEKVLAVAHTGELVDEEEFETVEFRALVEDSWEAVPTRQATLQFDDGLPSSVHVHPVLCRQLFENLFRNAVTHGGDDVQVRVGGIDGGVGFYVADDGPGIPADQRDAVFDDGYSTASGSGLGLVVVDRAAEYHGWNVFLTESEHGGARFEFLGLDRTPDG